MVDNKTAVEAALDMFKNARIASTKPEVEVIPTDFPIINDTVFGCGGIPRGKIVEIYSKPSVGKSTLAYWLIGQVQKQGGLTALFDAEGSYYPEYGAACGIDNDKLLLPEFTYGEDCLYIMKQMIATNMFDLIVLDSMPTLQPYIAAASTAEAMKMNIKLARAMMYTIFFQDLPGGYTIKGTDGKAIKSNKIYTVDDEKVDNVHKINDKKTCLICINHAKNAIGVMYGEREKTPCGEGINFSSSIRIGMKYIGKSKKKAADGGPLFKEVQIKAVKNKLAPPLNVSILRLMRNGRIEPGDIKVDYEVEKVQEDIEIRDIDPEEAPGILAAFSRLR